MTDVLLIQLPIPRLNYGRRTGNVPLGAACLREAARGIDGVRVDIMPASLSSFLGDAALLDSIVASRPDIVGFSAYCWNIERVLHLARCLKQALGPRIILGGPEVTPDNPLLPAAAVDFCVHGEGEGVFRRLLEDERLWRRRAAAADSGDIFKTSPSPYLQGYLEPWLEDIMLLETQRGCPYPCAYCYYNKSRRGLVFADRDRVLEAVRWACEAGIGELFLLDPTLSVRPDLTALLAGMERINHRRRLSIFSEIRAEGVDAALAERFAAAGFRGFEIGLQSTNPPALKAVRRPTDIDRFLTGVRLLKANGIVAAIDLMMGLPGDSLRTFKRSVDFLATHDLCEDVQLFPLALLPGTEFRARSRALGIDFDPHPPYTVRHTPGFGDEDFLAALDYAESRLDTVFYPPPDLDIAWRAGDAAGGRPPTDVYARLGGRTYLNKLMVARRRPLAEIERLARRLTHPYQVFYWPQRVDEDYLEAVLGVLTASNPFCPLEILLLGRPGGGRFSTQRLLAALQLQRPHFLDGDLRYMYGRPGNRTALFTIVCADATPCFQGDMQRQVFWWEATAPPEREDLERLFDLDGVLIDVPAGDSHLRTWQDRFAPQAGELPMISFARLELQARWLALTAADDYVASAMQWCGAVDGDR